jgi:hypothetical protein
MDLLYLLASIRRRSCTHSHHRSCGPGVLNAYLGLRQDLVIVNGMCQRVLLPDQPLLQRFTSLSDGHDSLLAFRHRTTFTFVAVRRSVSTSVATPHRTSDIPTYPKQTATDGCTTCKVDSLPGTVSSSVSHRFSLRLSRSRSYSGPCYPNFKPDQQLVAKETQARMTSDTTTFLAKTRLFCKDLIEKILRTQTPHISSCSKAWTTPDFLRASQRSSPSDRHAYSTLLLSLFVYAALRQLPNKVTF